MARPRSVTDEEILEAARRCVLDHGPGVSLARISREVGLSSPAILQRFGTKDALVFRALLPRHPPATTRLLALPPPADIDVDAVLVDLLAAIAEEFRQVGPALAALRMAPHAVPAVFPPDKAGPSVGARLRLARWLAAVERDSELPTADEQRLADVLLGAAEARGFLAWVGPQMVSDASDRDWAVGVVSVVRGR